MVILFSISLGVFIFFQSVTGISQSQVKLDANIRNCIVALDSLNQSLVAIASASSSDFSQIALYQQGFSVDIGDH